VVSEQCCAGWGATGGSQVRVTVAVRRHARRGQGAELVAIATRLLQQSAERGESLGSAWVVQSLSNADDVVVISDWDSREAYWESLRREDAMPQLDALSVGTPHRHFLQQLSRDERPGQHLAVLDCALLLTPPGATDRLITYMQDVARPSVLNAPGFVLRYLGQDEDEPAQLLLVRGWDSLEALEDYRLDVAPRFEPEWIRVGAVVERFMGYTRAELDRRSERR
jgi:quinol monooxygenase YgiN